MTLIESTAEQLVNDFSTFIVPSDSIKHIAAKNVIVHLNKLIKVYKDNKIMNDLPNLQLEYIKQAYK